MIVPLPSSMPIVISAFVCSGASSRAVRRVAVVNDLMFNLWFDIKCLRNGSGLLFVGFCRVLFNLGS